MANPAPRLVSPSEPRTLGSGRYVLLQEIGEGGMATVWRARDRRLNADVAVKILKPATAENARIRERFVNEARTMFRIRSANIVSVLDVVDEGDECFIAMELIDGASAKDGIENLRTRGKTMRPEQVIKVAIEVLEALVVAHKAGVIHCDVKPENVLIARDQRVLLMDFGVAHIDGIAQTKTGEVVGSLVYLAPEVIEQRDYTSEPSRDIFAVGCLIYELLTCELPTNICLAAYEPARLNVLPGIIRPIVFKAAHRVRDERYASAQEMLDELLRIQEEIRGGLCVSQEIEVPADPIERVPTPTLVADEPKPLPPLPKSRAQLARERLDADFAQRDANSAPGSRRPIVTAAVVIALVSAGIGWALLDHETPPEVAEVATVQTPEVIVEPTAEPPEAEVPGPEVISRPPPSTPKPVVKPVAKVVPIGEVPPSTPSLTHRPVTTAQFGETLTFTVDAHHVPVAAKATLRYRAKGAGSYSGVKPMSRNADTYSATLTVTEELAQGFDYFVTVEDKQGLKLQEGKPLKPHRVVP